MACLFKVGCRACLRTHVLVNLQSTHRPPGSASCVQGEHWGRGCIRPDRTHPGPCPLTDLLLDGMQQVDVILSHQCDGLSLPPCGTHLL